ncbi:MAG: hemerythrin family protein [Magnetospirillum sp.]|nr:hemerythrin family protein [Magnetospirillum sp.]
MDSDHDALVHLITLVDRLMAGSGDIGTISIKLVALYRLAEEHFSYEETLMDAIQAEPAHQLHIERHKEKHTEFIKQVMAISACAKRFEPVEVLHRMYGGVLAALLAEMLGLDADLLAILGGGRRCST